MSVWVKTSRGASCFVSRIRRQELARDKSYAYSLLPFRVGLHHRGKVCSAQNYLLARCAVCSPVHSPCSARQLQTRPSNRSNPTSRFEMRRQTSVSALLYSHLYPQPTANDPISFSRHLAKHLIPEIRIETARFYGSLDSIEARYPGLNYTYPPHIARLSRFANHARLFKAFRHARVDLTHVLDPIKVGHIYCTSCTLGRAQCALIITDVLQPLADYVCMVNFHVHNLLSLNIPISQQLLPRGNLEMSSH